MLKSKKVQLVVAMVIAILLFALFQNNIASNTKLHAKDIASSSVRASKSSPLGSLYLTDKPTDRGQLLTTYDAEKTIILGKTDSTSLPGKYSFIPRWTEKSSKHSGTEVLNDGFEEVPKLSNFTGKAYRYSSADFVAKKPANLTYTNVGLYKGKWIDIRITVSKVELNGGFHARNTVNDGLLIGGTSNDFNQVRLTRAASSVENRYPSVELTYDYLEHGTTNKIEVTGYNVFADIDHRESILLDENQMNLQNIIVPEDTKLSFKKTDGLLHLMPFVPGQNAPEDLASREEAKKSWAAYTFGPTSSYQLTFRMSESTTMADNEGLLPFETDHPNKVGYDNANTTNENNVEFSVYQYTPNNGKEYRYKTFTWLDPIHKAVKVQKAADVTLKLGQTQQELPKKYYTVTIDRNVKVPDVAADPENGVIAEPASTRDRVRVDFTEAFMTDKDSTGKLLMYGEMLQMDIKGTLDKENREAVQSTYVPREKAFIIPNRSELRYTDTIVSSGNQEKVVSSNTATSKIGSGETVQPFVSKKVSNQTAAKEGSNRQPKIGDILAYEMEVKNLSLVPTNVWKEVEIVDPLSTFLEIDKHTITLTQNGTTVKRPEYYDDKNHKLSLPIQEIKAEERSNLKINFSAKIKASGAGKEIDNWIHAKGVDLQNRPIKTQANALLPQKVEEFFPPIITLNEKVGDSTGEAKTLTGTFRDKDSVSVSLWYQVDSDAPKKITPAFKNDPKDKVNPYKFTIPKGELPFGSHTIVVYAIDSDGLKSNVETLLLDGVLQLVSSPTTLDFGELTYDAKTQKVENPTYKEQLVVLDSRGDRSKGWELSATLSEPMTNINDKKQILVAALRYVNKGKETTLGKAAVQVHKNKAGKDGKFVVSDTWGKTEGTDGIKLKINASDTVYIGDYVGKITWKIMPGQP